MDLYSIGEMLIDFIPGNEKDSYIKKAGGAPTNVAIAASKNGLDAGMCCSVGDDDFGRFLLDTLREYNVKIIKSDLCQNAITTMAFVSLDESGDRSFTFARKPGADMFIEDQDVKEEDIKNAKIVHAGSFTLSGSPCHESTLKALKLAHDNQKIVSFDLNYRDIVWDGDSEACKKAVHECLPYIDFMKISDEEECFLTDDKMELQEFFKASNLSLLVKTLGADGAECYYQDQIIKVPGKKVKAVDTTGAGDAFWGGFLSYLLFNDVEEISDLNITLITKALEYANVSGSLCVMKKGAIVAIPTRSEIEAELERD